MRFFKRRSLVDGLSASGISDSSVLEAFLKVPRDVFVSKDYEDLAYTNVAIPIGHEQSTSQPYIIALGLQSMHINNKDNVLEIGTGSGYQTALLAEIAENVYTLERLKTLLKKSKKILKLLGYKNIRYGLYRGDFDVFNKKFKKIIVSAGIEEVPQMLINILDDDGIMIIPVGKSKIMDLLKITKSNGKIQKEVLCKCRFVSLNI